MTDNEFNSQIEEAIRVVNANHERALEKQKQTNVEKNGLRVKMQEVLSRITGNGYGKEKNTKKQIICFYYDSKDKFLIKTSDGRAIGTISVGNNLERKIELSGKRPVFVIYRGNEVYLKKDVMTNSLITNEVSNSNYKKTVNATIMAEPMIEATRKIYELIDNKNYDLIDSYISNSMEKLIVNNDIDSTEKDKRDAYIKVQVLYRNIQKIKIAMASFVEITEGYAEALNQLDILYRQICEILINIGLYDLPYNDQELITRG